MVLPRTSSQNTTHRAPTLAHLPLEILLNIIKDGYWPYQSILSLLQVSKSFDQCKQAILKEHLKSQGIDYAQLEHQFGDAILPVEVFYSCYQKSRLFANFMEPSYSYGKGYYIPSKAWQVKSWPATTLVHPNTLTVLLILGNVACFQDVVRKYGFSAYSIIDIFNRVVQYETRLPFSIQSSLIEVIAGLTEKMNFSPNKTLVENSIRYGCEKLTYTLITQYHLKSVTPNIFAQNFVYSYGHPVTAKRKTWEECLTHLSLKLETEQTNKGQILDFHDHLLTHLHDGQQYSVHYANAILSRFIRYQYPGNREISAPTLGLVSVASDNVILQPYIRHITKKEHIAGNAALLSYAIAIGNAALVKHLLEVRHIPITVTMLYKVASIIANAYEQATKLSNQHHVQREGNRQQHAVDDLFCTLLKNYYAQQAHSLSLEEKQTFIINIIKAHLIQSGYFILSYEKNDILHSEVFEFSIFNAIRLFRSANNVLLVQLCVHYFPSFLTDPDLIHSIVSVGEYHAMWYLIDTYPATLPVDIDDIIRMAFEYRQLPIVQSIVERKSSACRAINWDSNSSALLEEEPFIETSDGKIKIDIARLDVLHYLVNQHLVAPLVTLEILLREIDMFHGEEHPMPGYIVNPQASYPAYATLLLTVLDKAMEQHLLDQTAIRLAIRTLKKLIKGGMLFEVLNNWLVKNCYPHVATELLAVEPAQFISTLFREKGIRFIIGLIGSDLKKLEALHALILHYQIQDPVLIPQLLDYILRDYAQRTDWVQLLIAQRTKIGRIAENEQALVKVKYDVLGEQWLQANYKDQLGPSVIEYLGALRM